MYINVFSGLSLFSKELKSRFYGFFTVQRTFPPAPLLWRGEQGAGGFVVFCLFVGKGRKRPLLTVFVRTTKPSSRLLSAVEADEAIFPVAERSRSIGES